MVVSRCEVICRSPTGDPQESWWVQKDGKGKTGKTKKRCFKAHHYAAPMSHAMWEAAW